MAQFARPDIGMLSGRLDCVAYERHGDSIAMVLWGKFSVGGEWKEDPDPPAEWKDPAKWRTNLLGPTIRLEAMRCPILSKHCS